MSAADLVRWHWEKAGTIEHVHRSMKDELGAGVLPSQRFGANAAWFRINAITYNLLTLLKRRALPERFRLARPKRLRFEIFNAPARLVVHQSQLIATLGATANEPRSWSALGSASGDPPGPRLVADAPVAPGAPGAVPPRARAAPPSTLPAFFHRRPTGLGSP